MSLNGKVILVTGAGQGIGRGIALRLAKEGANLALADVKADKLDSVRKEVEALGRKATTVVADVSKRDDVYAAIDHAEKQLGGFDVIVNNAGIAQVKPIADVTPEAFGNELAGQGVPADHIALLDRLFAAIRRGDNDHLSDGVRLALGREPRSFTEYASRVGR